MGMGMGNLDSGKDKNEKPGRAGRIGAAFGAGLAASLAAGTANAQVPGSEISTDEYITTVYGGYSSSFEYSASPEALDAVGKLMGEFGQDLSVTPEQVGKIKATVDAYVAAHPAYEGKTTVAADGKSSSSEPSYNPFYDLRQAMDKSSDDMNPLLMGLLAQELNKRIKAAAVEKSQ